MLSPAMFDRFVVPELDVYGEDHGALWYHLDGGDARQHLPRLLSLPYLRVVQYVPAPFEPPNGPGAQADPDACGETACWSRTPVAFTPSSSLLVATMTPDWKGNIAWDFGDGSDVMVGRGPVTHTYASANTYTVTASPIASACLKTGTADVTVGPA